MSTTLTGSNLLAFVEANIGYRLSDTQMAVVAMTMDNELACVACMDPLDDPVAAATQVEVGIERNTGQPCRFAYVSKHAPHVTLMREHGYACFHGVDDDEELAYLADAPVSHSREDFIAEWNFQAPVSPQDLEWTQTTYEERVTATETLLGLLADPTDLAVAHLLAALSGPVWIRDAVMIRMAQDLKFYEPVLKRAAQSTEDAAVLAPIMFATLFGGLELAARAVLERVGDDCDVSLVHLVRRCLDLGIAHSLAPQMLADDLLDACLRS